MPTAEGAWLDGAVAPPPPVPSGSEAEIVFISGVTSAATIAATSFWTWNRDKPPTYKPVDASAYKWGDTTLSTSGTAGGNVTYFFDTASGWTAAEQSALAAGLALWSAVANITFSAAASAGSADFTFRRGTDGSAVTSVPRFHTTVGSGEDGSPVAGATISIDTSRASFGPIGDITDTATFDIAGGYPLQTFLHEEGHMLGLGHGGPYNSGDGLGEATGRQFSEYDSRLWTVMSYINPSDSSAAFFSSYPVTGTHWGSSPDGYGYVPTTPMILDILAAQRLYGEPTAGPLTSGGQIFGFHTNVTGAIRPYFDFTVNRHPVITIWDGGTHNTLDLSGYVEDARIDLGAGKFTSANGMVNNIAIATDTVIETAIGGSGNDTITGNAANNVLDGRAGHDTMSGLAGDDMYRVDTAADVVVEAANQGADRVVSAVSYALAAGQAIEKLSTSNIAGTAAIDLTGNEFANTLEGNAGNNRLEGKGGADNMLGFGGHDLYFVDSSGDKVRESPNAGVDRVYAHVSYALLAGSSVETLSTDNANAATSIHLAGNQLANTIIGDAGNNVLTGLGGNDILTGGRGNDVIDGGTGNDIAVFAQDPTNYCMVRNADGTITIEHEFGAMADGKDRLISIEFARFASVLYNLSTTNIQCGGATANVIRGQLGVDDYIHGGGGNDTLYGDVAAGPSSRAGKDFLFGQDGNDTLRGDRGHDSLYGGDGNDVLWSGTLLDGGAGNDELHATYQDGPETLRGGAGIDIAFIDRTSTRVSAVLSLAHPSVQQTLPDGSTIRDVERMEYLAGSGNDRITGGALADTIAGNQGNDILDGGGGIDRLAGGLGNDTFYVDNARDTVIELARQGTDRVAASVSYSLVPTRAEIETLSTSNAAGTAAINLTGNEFANALLGNAGKNVLDGKGGKDTLTGFGGADHFRFDTALNASNVDTITDFTHGTDKIELENTIFIRLGVGTLAANAFFAGTAAHDSDDRIIYNRSSGALSFDADGAGGHSAVQFALLTSHPVLTNLDFLVT